VGLVDNDEKAIISADESRIMKYTRYLYIVTFMTNLPERALSPQAYIETFCLLAGSLGAFSLPSKYMAVEAARTAKKAATDSANVHMRLHPSAIEVLCVQDAPDLISSEGIQRHLNFVHKLL
jgi:hypothetical protein